MDTTTIAEVWKPVVGYEGSYAISNRGVVISTRLARGSWPGKIIKPKTCKTGYARICFCVGGVKIDESVHRLVLEAFVGPCPEKHECNHKNGVKTDNRVENLEWVTKSANAIHRFHVLKHMSGAAYGEKSGNAKINGRIARQIVKEWKEGRTFTSLGKKYGISGVTVGSVCSGASWWEDTGLPRKITSSALRRKKRATDKSMRVLGGEQ